MNTNKIDIAIWDKLLLNGGQIRYYVCRSKEHNNSELVCEIDDERLWRLIALGNPTADKFFATTNEKLNTRPDAPIATTKKTPKNVGGEKRQLPPTNEPTLQGISGRATTTT